MDDSYPLREKLTRDTEYIGKFLDEFLDPASRNSEQTHTQAQQKKDYLTFL